MYEVIVLQGILRCIMWHEDPYKQCPTQIEYVQPKFKVLGHLSNHFCYLISNTAVYMYVCMYVCSHASTFIPPKYMSMLNTGRLETTDTCHMKIHYNLMRMYLHMCAYMYTRMSYILTYVICMYISHHHIHTA